MSLPALDSFSGGAGRRISQHYMNWSASGDNHSSSTIYSLYNATNGLRAAQSAAAAAERGAAFPVAYCDLYTYMAARIAAGLDTQGSFGWHVADGNVHLNAYGQNRAGTWRGYRGRDGRARRLGQGAGRGI